MSRNRISTPHQKRIPKRITKNQQYQKKHTPIKFFSRVFLFLSKNLKSRLSKKIGLAFICIGIACIVVPRLSQLFPNRQEVEINPIKADSTFLQDASQSAVPVRIIIPSVSIDLAVRPARLIKGFWEVFEKTAGYGQGSATPGSIGNTVIFAHAREGLFLPLKNITFGKDIYVLTNNSWYQYRVDEVREVNPRDVYIIKNTTDERLTVFTCSGFLDQKRLVVIAKPIK